jgi:Domain of unknown function (DUF4177)
MKEYKVLTPGSGILSGNFNPAKLENALNDLASQGWIVVCASTVDIPTMRRKQELVIILERNKR